MGSEYLTMAEIEAKYPNEFVFLDQVKCRRQWGEIVGGRVLCHAPTREEYDRLVAALPDLPPGGVLASHHTGVYPAVDEWELCE